MRTTLAVRHPTLRALLVRADLASLEAALGRLLADASRAAILDRMRATGLADLRPHLAALTAVEPELAAEPEAWMPVEVHIEGGASIPLWPLDATPANVVKWLAEQASDKAAAALCGDQIRALFAEIGRDSDEGVAVGLAARAWLAWQAIEQDRKRAFMALDAGDVHHKLLGGMRDLPKDRKPRKVRVQDGWAEILHPGKPVGVRLNVQELPERIIHAVREWKGWQGLRHWAALQLLFTEAGRTGHIRWTLEAHMEALGYKDRTRRDPAQRALVANEVEALTRMEIAVYNPDGTLRVRGPMLAVTQRGEALEGAEWKLEGLELIIHPVLYEGIRNKDGSLGKLWAPAPAELATIDHVRHPHTLALGLIFPIRWRWDRDKGLDYLVLSGESLLAAAGIPMSPTNPGRAWDTLRENLRELQRVGGLGEFEWIKGKEDTLAGHCRLSAPPWIRDRLLHGITPIEAPYTNHKTPLTGSELIQWRKARGWTQAQAILELGVGERTLRRAEANPDIPLNRALRDGLERLMIKEKEDKGNKDTKADK